MGSGISGLRSRARLWFGRMGFALRVVIISLLFISGITLILAFPVLQSQEIYNLQLGDIAPEDILSPRDASYVSTIKTVQAREAAARSVEDIYDSPDPRVGRQQVRRAHQIMDFIRDVRADAVADTDLKFDYLQSIEGMALSEDTAQLILSINDDQFNQIEAEVTSLVEDAMSGTVRQGREEETKSRLELGVSSDLPESMIPATLDIARQLVVPNSLLNLNATGAARDLAVSGVEDVQEAYQTGEVIVRAGEPVDDLDLEALVALGLTSGGITWQRVVSALIAALLSFVVLTVYLSAERPVWGKNLSHVRLVGGIFLIFVLMAQILMAAGSPLAYLFPAAALAMAVRALTGAEFAALVAIVMAGLVGYLSSGSLEMSSLAAISGLLGAGSLPQNGRLSSFFRSGMVAAMGSVAVIAVLWLPATVTTTDVAQVVALILLNGLLSTGITLVILVAVGGLTDFVTSLQLFDLTRPDHPLQRRLQQEALGTYQHTLSVSNLVEAAAEDINADTLLARVGTMYHDIGKMGNPGFFIENRIEGGSDPHDALSPQASAEIIRKHVRFGLDLARKYRLPKTVVAFIAEHHGTLPILFFLERARKVASAAGHELDESGFFYEGPEPTSRETAILMLADGCESAVRANRTQDSEDIARVVNKIFQQRLDLGQLTHSGLTLDDIQKIKEAFVRTLKGMYHPRIQYPGDERANPQPDNAKPKDKPQGRRMVL